MPHADAHMHPPPPTHPHVRAHTSDGPHTPPPLPHRPNRRARHQPETRLELRDIRYWHPPTWPIDLNFPARTGNYSAARAFWESAERERLKRGVPS